MSEPPTTNAAPDAPQRNRPRFEDLPIPDDTANLREGPDLHPDCLGLLPLVGVWRGAGEVVYPTIDGPYPFGQQLVFAHDGRPFLSYEARAWLLGAGRRGAAARGPRDRLLAPATRRRAGGADHPRHRDHRDLLRAGAHLTSWELETDAVVRTASAKDVVSSHRLYGLVDGGDLAYVDERAMMGQPQQPHLSAQLRRIAG